MDEKQRMAKKACMANASFLGHGGMDECSFILSLTFMSGDYAQVSTYPLFL